MQMPPLWILWSIFKYENCAEVENEFKSSPDNCRAIHSHDDDAEQGGPESNPEPGGEVVPLCRLAVGHEDLLEDEDGAGAAEDSEGLPGQQTEDSPGQQVTHEGLQHALGEIFQILLLILKIYLQILQKHLKNLLAILQWCLLEIHQK